MNINQLMKQARQAQAKVEESKKKLAKEEFIVTKQGLKITMMGNRQIKSIEIDEILVDPDDIELLQEILILAINEATEKVNEQEAQIMPQG